MNGYSLLLDRTRQTVRERNLSRKTEEAYLNHIRCFLNFHGECDLSTDRSDKIRAFLSYLEQQKNVSASTFNQARCALLFLYRDVFGQKISKRLANIERAHPPRKLPVVLTSDEAKAILANLHGAVYLVAALLYGSGLRLAEAVTLRLGDIDFEKREIIVCDAATGRRERTTMLPDSLIAALQKHLVKVKYQHEDDCLTGGCELILSDAAHRRDSEADFEWHRQYVFPAHHLTTGEAPAHRGHLAQSTVQKAFAEAVGKAKIYKPAYCHSLRHSFAVRLLEKNCDVYTIRNLLGHKNLRTTMIYTNFHDIRGVIKSPLDV